jgi:acyl-CoA dehydrogenase
MKVVNAITTPDLGYSWFDADLSEEQRSIQKTVHDFCTDHVRPICKTLDRMSAEQVVERGSPWYPLRGKYLELGFDYKAFDGMTPQQACKIQALVVEELGWGDMGFCIGMMVDGFPKLISAQLGRRDLAEKYANKIGCWIATQPDRGSDVVDFQGREVRAGTQQHRGNIVARLKGDKLVIHGQSSAWVSLGPVAEVAVAMIPCDYGDGLRRPDGVMNGVLALVPLDLPGVSKGAPLEKLGQRPLPQGEIYFDNVEVPADYILLGKDGYDGSVFSLLSEGNTVHAAAATGIARAAFEHALKYVHERRQGGTELMNHQLVRHRIYKMFQEVEVCRAIARRAYDWFANADDPEIAIAICAKTYCTQKAFEVASEAIQMLGGNGLTREYPVEKLMRDARATMIEDGESHILGLVAAGRISDIYKSSSVL